MCLERGCGRMGREVGDKKIKDGKGVCGGGEEVEKTKQDEELK